MKLALDFDGPTVNFILVNRYRTRIFKRGCWFLYNNSNATDSRV